MPGPNSCPDPERIRLFLLGQSTETDSREIEQHLAFCESCRKFAKTVNDDDPLLDALRAGGLATPVVNDEQLTLQQRLFDLASDWVPGGSEATQDGSSKSSPATAILSSIGPGHLTERTVIWPQDMAPPAAPGEMGRIGSFRILKILGRGGMGVVYQALQDRPRRIVALKVFQSGFQSNAERIARFRAEAEVVARLQHANIVQVYEVDEYEGKPFFTMEYLEGGSLAQRLSLKPLQPREAAQLLEVLATAIQHVHERGIVHRDLKPSNVLLAGSDMDTLGPAAPALSPGSIPKIADFGLAKYFDDIGIDDRVGYSTETGAILGTPGYMAPEQAAGRSREVGPAADIYSLGVILYECLTGRPPFKAATILDLLEQIRTQEPVPPSRLQPRLPRDIQTICMKCLEKDPARRYASAGALADDLGRFLRQEPIKAQPASRRQRLGKWARRKPAMATLIALSTLSALALVVGMLVHSAMLQAALTETGKQRQRADANYREAREAIGRMLKRLDDQSLVNHPRLNELRQHQLEEALRFYEEVLNGQQAPDDAVRYDAALAYFSAGQTEVSLNSPDEAARNLHMAADLLEDLSARYPESAKYRLMLANTYTALGALATLTDVSQSMSYYKKSLALGESLYSAAPDDVDCQNLLAVAHLNCGSAYLILRDGAGAEQHFNQSVAQGKVLMREHPDTADYKFTLVNNYANLVTIYRSRGEQARAEKILEEAESLLAPLVRARPERLDYAVTLGAIYTNWGYAVGAQGRLKAALEIEDKAVDTLEKLLTREPRHEGARSKARSAHGARAEVLQALSRFADAVKDWDSVIDLSANQAERNTACGSRALAFVWAGNHAAAYQAAADLATQKGSSFLAAKVDALCVEAVLNDKQLASSARAALAEQYAAAAMSILKALLRDGYFADAAHCKKLQTDQGLNLLRLRSDFRELVSEAISSAAKK